MPVARFQMPDGRIGRFEVPEGTSPEQATKLIGEHLSSQGAPPSAPTEDTSKSIPDSAPAQTEYKPPQPTLKGPGAGLLGMGEAALTLGSGAIAAPIGAAAGLYRGFTGGKYGTPEGALEAQRRAAEVADSLTYRPRSLRGQQYVETASRALDASKLAGLGPTEAMALSAAPKPRLPGLPLAQSVGQPRPFGAVGSAAVDPVTQAKTLAARASPELQAAVEKAGPNVNLETLARHVEADTLPVPVRLTKGQATQDVSILSNEQNLRGKHEQLARHFNDQNKALTENVNAIKEAAAPDVYATTTPELGDSLIQAYKKKDAALESQIAARYKALTDANGGKFPIDGVAFVDSADAALHKNLLFDHVPGELRKTLDRLRDGGKMTFENFESLRTNLARLQRSPTADGNAKAAAGTIRNALEELPLSPEAGGLKNIADAARAAARERFAMIESDPAYKAVVNGKASADKFVDKYVAGADVKHVETMKKNLANDPHALQTMAAGAISRLKASANIVNDTGNFSQAGYNKALEGMRPKLGVLFEPQQREHLEALGNVARNAQAQPRGAFVNNSNTAVAALAQKLQPAAEAAVNTAAGGLPVGTLAGKLVSKVAAYRDISGALKPGAGIKGK